MIYKQGFKIYSLLQLSLFIVIDANLNAKGFIRTQGTKFVDANCEQFIVNGWNSWEMIEGVLNKISYADVSVFGGQDPLQWMMDKGTSIGMNTFRIFGHGHDSSIMTLQYSPGSYDEGALTGLDMVLAEAANRNLKVILTFADNWKNTDSKKNYEEWSGLLGTTDAFWYDEGIKSNFKNHMSFMVSRTNSVNGRVYRDDPTILAWNLINEPRSDSWDCNTDCEWAIQTWIDEMAAFVKSIDHYHMVTVGEEGFYGWNSGKEHVNPDSWNGDWGSWAMKSGQNFVPNHSGAGIDFAATHIWVDDWAIYHDPQGFFGQWLDEHANDASALNKPLLIEEFGKKADHDGNLPNDRDPFFSLAYYKAIESINADGAIQGVMWWEWENDESSPLKEYDVKTYHSTWNDQIVPNSGTITSLRDYKPLVPNCVPGDTTSFDVVYADGDEFVYYKYLPKILATSEGETMLGADGAEFAEGISREECASRCESMQPDCTSFAYNEGFGQCFLKKGESAPDMGFAWNVDGWSTHWRSIGSYGDCTPGSSCSGCSTNGVCIRCNEGYVLDRDNDPEALPYCRGNQAA